MIKMLNRFFLRGLIVVVPVALSIYILALICIKAEALFGGLIKSIIGPENYAPGLGMFGIFLFVIFVGALVSHYLTGKIVNFFISKLENAPLIKAIYRPLKDLMTLFGGGMSNNTMKKVVAVQLPHGGGECIGLVTREEFSDMPANSFDEDKVAVYIPMSYMLGGFTLIVPRSNVRELNIPVERALKLAITGWITSEKNARF